ncbi:hypothetical protein [Streptomyces asoensis]|uniref:Thymidylate kinase-like domain-containing protein n=1 Tax=Streptomyces asoensis TaxID=249586 RepID=A0ABQ3SCU9_9ACTN|nr:hypothetical protein [Streptomyces asoensis]GGQ97640.1 hypothetical protein GCM10010496_73300 [Streptomyces asoensis]GHI65747.1 hypothetical protein Saso_73970 [Streptomyces asoensis]
MPDLAVILTAEPDRIAERGITHRWRLNPTDPPREVDLYRETAAYLTSKGVRVLLLDNSAYTPSDVARRIADLIPPLPLLNLKA